MEINLNEYCTEKIARHLNRYKNTYKKRMADALDKTYAHNQYVSRIGFQYSMSSDNELNKTIFNYLEHDYKVGIDVERAIRRLKESCKNPKLGIQIELDEAFIEEQRINELMLCETINNLTEIQIVDIFADLIVFEQFLKFLHKQEGDLKETAIQAEHAEKSNGLSMPQQVLVIYYLLKCANYDIDNGNKKELSRFIGQLGQRSALSVYAPLKKIPNKIHEEFSNKDFAKVKYWFEVLNLSMPQKFVIADMSETKE